nr:diacylglycerol kinase [Spiribacter halobius]
MVHAAGYSLRGLRLAWRGESAFRQEVALALLLLPAAFWLGRDPVEVSLLVVVVMVVLITELLNTGVEAVVDRVGHEHHELAGMAKDVGSAAVMLSLLLTGFVWGAILWGRFVG